MKEVELKKDLLALNDRMRENQTNKNINNAILDISSVISSSYSSGETRVSFDIGIGNLYTEIVNDNVKWKFIPSNRLEKETISAIRTGKDPLIDKLSGDIVKRLHSYE